MSSNQKKLSEKINGLLNALDNINTNIPTEYKFYKNNITDITGEKTLLINKFTERLGQIYQIINQQNRSDLITHNYGTQTIPNVVNLGPSDNLKIQGLFDILARQIKTKPRKEKNISFFGTTISDYTEKREFGDHNEKKTDIKYYYIDYPELESVHCKIYLKYVLGILLCLNISFNFIKKLLDYSVVASVSISTTPLTSSFNEENIKKSWTEIFINYYMLSRFSTKTFFNLIFNADISEDEEREVFIINSGMNIESSTLENKPIIDSALFTFNNIPENFKIAEKPKDNPDNHKHYLDLKIKFRYISDFKNGLDGKKIVYKKCIQPYRGEEKKEKDKWQYDETGKDVNIFKIIMEVEEISLVIELEVRYYYCKYFREMSENFRYQFIIRINGNAYYINPSDIHIDSHGIRNVLKYTEKVFENIL